MREREAGDFALVSVAAALTLDGDGDGAVISQGSRRHSEASHPVPYRAVEVEEYLTGRRVDAIDPAEAATLALPNATPLPQNGYKVPMARNTIKRALTSLLAAQVE